MNTINNSIQQIPNGRVNPSNEGQNNVQQTKSAENTAVSEQTHALVNSSGDQVKFTPEAQTLLKMTQLTKDVSDIDQNKVNRIKQALENGDYPIDALQVARKIVSLERLLQ